MGSGVIDTKILIPILPWWARTQIKTPGIPINKNSENTNWKSKIIAHMTKLVATKDNLPKQKKEKLNTHTLCKTNMLK